MVFIRGSARCNTRAQVPHVQVVDVRLIPLGGYRWCFLHRKVREPTVHLPSSASAYSSFIVPDSAGTRPLKKQSFRHNLHRRHQLWRNRCPTRRFADRQ